MGSDSLNFNSTSSSISKYQQFDQKQEIEEKELKRATDTEQSSISQETEIKSSQKTTHDLRNRVKPISFWAVAFPLLYRLALYIHKKLLVPYVLLPAISTHRDKALLNGIKATFVNSLQQAKVTKITAADYSALSLSKKIAVTKKILVTTKCKMFENRLETQLKQAQKGKGLVSVEDAEAAITEMNNLAAKCNKMTEHNTTEEELQKWHSKLKESFLDEDYKVMITDALQLIAADDESQGKEVEKEVEDVTIRTEDGIELDGCRINHPDQRNKFPEQQKWVICLHGNKAAYQLELDSVKWISDRMKANALTFNFRGIENKEAPELSEDLVKDAEAAVDHLLKQGVKPENITIYGHSQGGAVAAKAASRKNKQTHLIVDRSFSTYAAAAEELGVFKSVPRVIRCFLAALSVLVGWVFNSAEVIPSIKDRNVVILQHEEDEVIGKGAHLIQQPKDLNPSMEDMSLEEAKERALQEAVSESEKKVNPNHTYIFLQTPKGRERESPHNLSIQHFAEVTHAFENIFAREI